MANASIKAAFERMWNHIVTALDNKSDIDHSHSYDGALSGESTNAVQNKVATNEIVSVRRYAEEGILNVNNKIGNINSLELNQGSDTPTTNLVDAINTVYLSSNGGTTASSLVSAHNTATDAHADIREEIAQVSSEIDSLKKIYIGDTAPTNISDGTIWIDTSEE